MNKLHEWLKTNKKTKIFALKIETSLLTLF